MRKSALFLALAFCLTSTLAHGPRAVAADAHGNYAVWGVGQASCNQFTKAYAKQAFQDYKNYLGGYLTAFNMLADDVYQATGKNNTADNLALLQVHCRGNPMHSFEHAVQSLLAQTQVSRQNSQQEKSVTWGRPPTEQAVP